MKTRSIYLEDLCNATWEPDSERTPLKPEHLAAALEAYAKKVRSWPQGTRWYVGQTWDSPTTLEVEVSEPATKEEA